MTHEIKAMIQTRIGTPTLTNVALGSPDISNYYNYVYKQYELWYLPTGRGVTMTLTSTDSVPTPASFTPDTCRYDEQ